ncbi:MAG: ECF subfamily RNA polymerase sigma-70 factor [Chlorobi bacterium OLB6]|nr:MAG: ECF subfamily RNA polymerase sigma-70 factor [Chlorobi bacterium OLB6]
MAKRRNKQTMAYDQLSDEEVFALVQSANDQLAFKTLYGRYNKRIYAYCLRVLGNREDANDVFQIIAMAIYDKRDSFKDGSFVAWLFTITRNTCLKAVRNRRTTTELNEEIHTNLTSVLLVTTLSSKIHFTGLFSHYRMNSAKLLNFDTSTIFPMNKLRHAWVLRNPLQRLGCFGQKSKLPVSLLR